LSNRLIMLVDLRIAEKALEMGRGRTSRLSSLTGMLRVTITSGMAELRGGKRLRDAGRGRVRAPGGGRKKVEEADPGVFPTPSSQDRDLTDLELVVRPDHLAASISAKLK
jgi:hypothetical protein